MSGRGRGNGRRGRRSLAAQGELPGMEGSAPEEPEPEAVRSPREEEADRTVRYWIQLEAEQGRQRKLTERGTQLVLSKMQKHKLTGGQIRTWFRWIYTSDEFWPTHMRGHRQYSGLDSLLRDQSLRDRLPGATGGKAGVERIEVRIGHMVQVWVDGRLVETREVEK